MTEDDILRRIEETSVLIYDQSDSGAVNVGSGYLVARGYVGTASHVVRHWVEGVPRSVIVNGFNPPREVSATLLKRFDEFDAAVLALNDIVDIEPLCVGELPLTGTDWRGYGYPQAARAADAAVGLPITGRVNDARWGKQHGRQEMLLGCNEASAAQGTSLRGWSGSPVVVDGQLVGHVSSQFGDPEDRTRAAYGIVRARPIHGLVAFLQERGAMFGRESASGPSVPSRTAPAAPVDKNLLPGLLAWCDRDKIVDQLRMWLKKSDAPSAGLLCLVGHSENRESLLLQRVADELSEVEPRVFTRCEKILRSNDLENEEDFRYIGTLGLGVEQDADIVNAKHYQDGARLVLLSLPCDCDRWPRKVILQKLRDAAQWLRGLSLGNIRLVLVLTMRHGANDPLHLDVSKKVTAAIKVLGKDAASPFGMCRTGRLIELEPYERGHVISWRDKAVVISGLGRSWSALNDATVSQWFVKPTLGHGELEQCLMEFHKNNP